MARPKAPTRNRSCTSTVDVSSVCRYSNLGGMVLFPKCGGVRLVSPTSCFGCTMFRRMPYAQWDATDSGPVQEGGPRRRESENSLDDEAHVADGSLRPSSRYRSM